MKRILSAVFGAVLLTGATSLSAQGPGGPGAGGPPPAQGEIRGTVVDADANAGIPRASVAVRTKEGALITGAIASSDGRFQIQGLRPGTYVLRVTFLGYAPKIQEFTITPAAPRVAAGNIGLTKVAVALEGVEVKGEREAVTIEPDRNSYKSKDVAPAANNATEVLENVPSVAVDGEGKVSLRGNENVAVQINGRPAPLRGPQLAAYLKQIPANILDRIEVIPNPSAKYDPEGMAGIINIVLKQNVDLGMSGGFNVSGATADRFNTGGNLGYQVGPKTFFASYGYNSDKRGLTGINDRERYDALSAPLSFTEQDIFGKNANAGHNFTSTFDYKVNTRDVLTNSLLLNRRRNSEDSRTLLSELNAVKDPIDTYDRIRDQGADGWMVDYTIALKRTLEPRKHEISTELRYNRSDDNDLTLLWRQPINGTSQLERESNKTDALTQSLNAQLDYTRTLAERTKLETGYKGTGRWLDRDYLVMKDALGSDQWVESSLSNDFTFNEMVQAGYGVLSRGVGKWDLQAGLRAEYANRDFTLGNNGGSFTKSYTSLFPSGVASYKFNDKLNGKLSYSRRIRRPGTQELNPFPSFMDAQNVFIGNPNLNPEYTHAIEGGLTRTGALGSLQFSPFYRRTTDVIRVDINTDDVIDGRNVTSVSFQNLATSDSYGADMNGTLRLGKKFNMFSALNVFRIVTDGGSESTLSSDAVAWGTRLNATFNATEKLTVQGNWNYRAPINVERGRFAANQSATFSGRYKIMGDKATVALRVVDPFNTIGFKIRAGDDKLIQITERQFGVRGTFLSFQYTFGQAPRIRQPQQQPQEPQAGFPSGG
jgi:outer membrane receptor protein involved in Fe transport